MSIGPLNTIKACFVYSFFKTGPFIEPYVKKLIISLRFLHRNYAYLKRLIILLHQALLMG